MRDEILTELDKQKKIRDKKKEEGLEYFCKHMIVPNLMLIQKEMIRGGSGHLFYGIGNIQYYHPNSFVDFLKSLFLDNGYFHDEARNILMEALTLRGIKTELWNGNLICVLDTKELKVKSVTNHLGLVK